MLAGGATDDGVDAVDQLPPRRTTLAECRLPGPGEAIGPADAPAHRARVAPEVAGLLEAIERGIDGAFGEVEPAAAPESQRLDDGVAVRRAAADDGQHHEIDLSGEHRFALHT